MESVKKLLGFNFDADVFARSAPLSSKPSQQNLDILEEIIRTQGNDGNKPPNQEDLHQIYQLFIQASRAGRLPQEFGTSKRIRQLAWALTFSENKHPRIVDTAQLQDALQIIESRFRTSSLLGVFNALMQSWDTPNANMLRSFVKKHLKNYNGTRKSVQKLKANMDWYCEKNSTTQLAMTLHRSNKKLSDVWALLELPDWTQTYRYFGAVAETFVSLNRNINREILEDLINFLKKHNNDKTSRSILSKLIEKPELDMSEQVRAPVQSYVLREWQDPRIAGADVKWHGVSPNARKIFTKWLTEADLEFFFGIVAKACNDPKFKDRKEFWLSYLNHIEYCRPVLRKNVEGYLGNQEALQFYRERRPATLTGGNRNQHAFIIQMINYTFVEFSTSGACYVYDKVNPPFDLYDEAYHLSELRRTDLKKKSYMDTHKLPLIHWQPHKGSWKEVFAKWLEDELGIDAKF